MRPAPLSIRVAITAGAVLTVTLLAGGCGQSAPPTSPTSVGPIASTAGTSSRWTTANSDTLAPVLAQLNLVDTLLVSANHQLNLFLFPPTPVLPPNPCDQSALDFYMKADAMFTDAANQIPAGPPGPIADALHAIRSETNVTFSLLQDPPRSSALFPAINAEATNVADMVVKYGGF